MNYKHYFIAFLSAVAVISTPANASSTKKNFERSDSQTAKVTQTNSDFSSFSSSFKPPNKSQPKYTIGGATRGDSCTSDRDNNEVTALVPEKAQSLTLQSHPTLFAYVSPMNTDKPAILIVKDKVEDYYFSQKFTLPAAGGIVKMSLSPEAPELEINKDYTWFLRIQCNADNLEPEDPQISASIMRVDSKIPNLDRSSSVLFYANSQIWYDSLDNAFELYQSGKDAYWLKLLNNVEMDRLVAR